MTHLLATVGNVHYCIPLLCSRFQVSHSSNLKFKRRYIRMTILSTSDEPNPSFDFLSNFIAEN